jgi:hypothetical protein
VIRDIIPGRGIPPGKDGTPFVVDVETYDKTVEVLRAAVNKANIDRSERVRALELLTWTTEGTNRSPPGWISRHEGAAMTRVWLLVLAGVLVLWQPATFVGLASATIPSLAIRGWMAVVELIVAGAIAATSMAAAWALVMRQPHGVSLAKIALVLSAVRSLQSLYWTTLPSNLVPGTQETYAVMIVVVSGVWLVYLSRSRGVKALS